MKDSLKLHSGGVHCSFKHVWYCTLGASSESSSSNLSEVAGVHEVTYLVSFAVYIVVDCIHQHFCR